MPKRSDVGMTLLRQEGATEWWGNGYWHHPWLIRNVLCGDGRRRTVYLGQDADTYFSWPGRAKIAGKWATGFVSTDSDLGEVVFTAVQLQEVSNRD